MKTIALILLIIAPSISFAKECNDCVERKKQMCSSECELVGEDQALKCQKDCIMQYCSHKCAENDEALKNLLEASCEKCQDEQFNLCSCPVGSDRSQAACKIECAVKKCKAICK